MGPTRRGANAKMLGKLLVVAAGMFAFGYALIPIYRQICEVTGINILSLSERQGAGNRVGGGGAGEGGGGKGCPAAGEYAGGQVAHDHRGVRCQRARPMEFQARPAFGAGASRRVDDG